MFMKHFSFFSRLSKQLSHLALIPSKHQENCDLSIFSETGEGRASDSHRGGRAGASWEERSVRDARQPKTTGHKARVMGDTGQSMHFISPLYASSMLHPPERECFFFSFCTERMREGWCKDSRDVRAEERERERLSTDSSSGEGSGNSGQWGECFVSTRDECQHAKLQSPTKAVCAEA